MTTIAIATCPELPELDDDERPLVDALQAAGAEVEVVVWSDPAVVWRMYDAVVIRSTWDYTDDPVSFVEWALRVQSVSRLLNPADVVAWNIDKRYLRDLDEAGVPIVPTFFIEPSQRKATVPVPEHFTEIVVKPAISAGSRDTSRYLTTTHLEAAAEHVDRLLDEDRVVMVQPYVESVDEVGETALIFIDGEYSHSIIKGQMLHRDKEVEKVAGLYVKEQISPTEPTDEQLAIARAALDAVPGGPEQLLYARVDIVRDAEGNLIVLELELTEPSLFYRFGDRVPERLAAAIMARTN